jgi:hypothetical protein
MGAMSVCSSDDGEIQEKLVGSCAVERSQGRPGLATGS